MKKVLLLTGVVGMVFIVLSLACVRDTDPPEVQITSPADGDTVLGIVTIKAEASDASPVLSVSFLVDSSEIAKDTIEPWECDWNTLNWADSSQHTIQAKAVDKFDNEGSSAPVGVLVVLPSNPPLTPQAPSGPSRGMPDSLLSFSATTTDPEADSISFQFDWGGDTSTWTPYVASADTVTQENSFSAEGTYQIRVRAKDTYSVTSAWSPALTITISPIGQPKWIYETGGPIYNSSPAIGQDGTIYFGSCDSFLYALNADGSLKWRYRAGGPVSSSPVIGPDGSVYFRVLDDSIYALTSDGKRKWTYFLGPIGDYDPPPVIGSDGTIYYVAADCIIIALTPAGEMKWGYGTCQVHNPPAVGRDGTIYYGADCGGMGGIWLYALNPDSTLKWKCELNSAVASPLAIGSDGTIYFGAGRLFNAVRPQGTVKWYYYIEGIGGVAYTAPAIGSDGTIYFGATNVFYVLTPSGTLKWRYLAEAQIAGSPAVGSDGTVYFGCLDGFLYALSPQGTLEWRYQTGNAVFSPPSIGSDGLIYFGSYNGRLYALMSTSKGLASSSWPKYQHDNQNTGRAR